MPLILYAQTVFGILFVIRTLQIFRTRALLSTSTVTKTGTLYVCASAWISFFYGKNGFFCSLLNLGCIFITLFALFLCERRQIDALKREVPLFLDRWILNLRLGLALPTAREAALRDHSESFQLLVHPIFATQNAYLTKRKHLLFQPAVLEELDRIQEEPHAALMRLEILRHVLRKTAEFRRKSGQATRQTHIQSLVMLVLTFALVAFTLHRYGWKRSADLICAAIVLSAIGVISMTLVSRKWKWKI